MPPKVKKQPGRPKKSMRREPGETPSQSQRSNTLKCGKCGGFGHNKRTCTVTGGQEVKGKRAANVVDKLGPNTPMADMLAHIKRKRRMQVDGTSSTPVQPMQDLNNP